jgi:type III pantothenate kinase
VAPPAGGEPPPAHWLLIGNSRWHWARPGAEGAELLLWHTPPAPGPLGEVASQLIAWAAVGAVSADAGLPPERRLPLAAVPLAKAPPTLGIDRALAGWQAWRAAGGPVLVADAGTVLSLTRVDREGAFAGGRLMAGVALQARAMAAGTAALPCLDPESPDDRLGGEPPSPWPTATAAAMRSGVLLGLAAAVAAGLEAAVSEAQDCRLVLTGGDGPALLDLVHERLRSAGLGGRLEHRPALVLEGMAALATAQARPRSARI